MGELEPGKKLELREPKPWDEPVDGEALLDEIREMFRRFLVLPKHAATALALWAAFTHGFELFDECPRLAVTSPTKRCGKTRLFRLLEPLVVRPLRADSVTSAVVYRVVEASRPTLLIDEADSFMVGNEGLRNVLNSGHIRGGNVLRNVRVGSDWEARSFSTWCPVAIALIGKLPDTLADRSIEIRIRRKRHDEQKARPSRSEFDALEVTARKLRRWVSDNERALGQVDPVIPESLHDRAADNWRPLLGLTDLAGGPWPERARHAAIAHSDNTEAAGDAASTGEALIADIQWAFSDKKTDRLSSEQLCQALATIEGHPWDEWKGGKPITKGQLAALLRSFGIVSTTIRIGAKTPKGYYVGQFEDAFSRYLPAARSATPPQPLGDSDSADCANRNESATVCDPQLSTPVASDFP
jgi:putative DNA primase/helicase